jgi:hypothetical protein
MLGSKISVNSVLNVTRQSDLLDVNRTSVYYVTVETNLAYENQIKERQDGMSLQKKGWRSRLS